MRAFALIPLSACALAGTLDLAVLDEKGAPVAARLKLRDGQGMLVRLAEPLLPIHPRYPELGVVLPGKGKIRTPPGPHTAIVERGTEYRPEEIAVEGDVTRTVRLQRWIDMKKRGWWSGDLHVHRKPDEMPPLMEAADLHFAPVITRWNTNSNLDAWPEKPHFPAGRNRAYTVDNSEDERDWGAALFFGLKTPIGLYGRNAHYPPPTVTWREARARSAFIDQEKLIWWAAPMIAALVAPDSMGVANNHFMEESVMDNEAWGRKRDLAKYPGPRGFANYILDLYYLYLNAGFRIPASAGSANGVLKNPAGYSRSYVNLGGRFSAEAWLAGQKAGRNFVTNGPMLFLKVSGARVELEAISGGELEKAELVSGGKVVKTFEPGADRSRIAGSARVKVEAGGWLAARCFEKNNATVRFAHTSPVYFGAHAARTPEALAAMRGWLDALVEHIGQLPGLSMEQRTEWYALCAQAREVYQ